MRSLILIHLLCFMTIRGTKQAQSPWQGFWEAEEHKPYFSELTNLSTYTSHFMQTRWYRSEHLLCRSKNV